MSVNDILSYVITFTCLWWLVAFMLLPIGVGREALPGDEHKPGGGGLSVAKKAVITTIITVILTPLTVYGINEMLGHMRETSIMEYGS